MKIPDTSAKKILVVEDESAISRMCQIILTGEGFELDIAENGKVAQGLIGKKEYDLCLIDIRTPTMNGKELYQWLEEKYPQLASRVIFTTGDVMIGDTQDFIERSGRPFIPKPFSTGELKAIISNALKRTDK